MKRNYKIEIRNGEIAYVASWEEGLLSSEEIYTEQDCIEALAHHSPDRDYYPFDEYIYQHYSYIYNRILMYKLLLQKVNKDGNN